MSNLLPIHTIQTQLADRDARMYVVRMSCRVFYGYVEDFLYVKTMLRDPEGKMNVGKKNGSVYRYDYIVSD